MEVGEVVVLLLVFHLVQ